MANTFWRKFFVFLIAAELIFNQYFLLPTKIKAMTLQEEQALDNTNIIARPLLNISNQPRISPAVSVSSTTCSAYLTELARTQPYKEKIYKFFEGFWDPSKPFKFDDMTQAFTNDSKAKLIFNQRDLNALRGLYCSNRAAPNFDEDLVNLYLYLSTETRKKIPSDYISYLTNLKYGTAGETADQASKRRADFSVLSEEARNKYAENWREIVTGELDKIKSEIDRGVSVENAIGNSGVDIQTLKCVTGMTQNEITNYLMTRPAQLFSKAKDSIDGLLVDIRILKAIVYLVTPKDQGGAGHWRIKVRKILQPNPNSNESESIYQELNNKGQPVRPTSCDGMTASECGQQANDSDNPDLEITDETGEQYDAYLSSINEDERNISAHKTGQAIDIEQIDDIRCTIIGRKRLNWFGNDDSVKKQEPNPVKLAWQTSDSYAASGGNPVDLAGIMKQSAVSELQGFLLELGTDTTGYEGDLANANIGDYGNLIARSLVGQMLGSESLSIPGDTLKRTLENLGGSIFADYIGVPREIFAKEKIRSIDDLKFVIGRSALEKRLNIPFGSLDSTNYEESKATGSIVSNLEGLYLNAGKRKLEYEMNLNQGDLDGYVSSGINPTSSSMAVYIGQRVIEKSLNLPKGSFVVRGENGPYNFKDLKNQIGTLKLTSIEINPAYMDNLFHIDAGVAKSFTKGEINALQLASKVGQRRLDDSVYGFRYFASSDSAYELPENTWENAVLGDKTSVMEIGISAIAKVMSTGIENENFRKYSADSNYTVAPADIGKTATRQWLKEALTKEDEASCTPSINSPSKQVMMTVTQKSNNAVIVGEQVDVKINIANFRENGLTQGDVYRMFGCANSSDRAVFEKVGGKLLYYGLVSRMDGRTEGTTYDLLDANSVRAIEDNNFYLSRKNQVESNIDTANKIYDEIKNDNINWQQFNTSINRIKGIFEGIQAESDFSLNSIAVMAQAVVGISGEFDRMKDSLLVLGDLYENERSDKINQLNLLISTVNETILLCEEIIAGHDINTSDTITIDQIDASALSTTNNNGSNSQPSSQRQVSAMTIFNFLAGKISVTEFILLLGTSRAESNLGLPQNSFLYFLHNAEDKGISTKESFYQAVGQAKIEQSLGMNLFDFQGPSLRDQMPSFRFELDKLAEWTKNETFEDKEDFLYNNGYYASSPTTARYSSDLLIEYLSILRATRDPLFDHYINIAKTKWQAAKDDQVKSFGGTAMKEYMISDVIDNLASRASGAPSSSSKSYLVDKFGLPANYDALVSGASGAWAVAGPAATQVDNSLGIPNGSTKTLFTGVLSEKISLSNKEIQYLEAKLGLPKNAIELFIQLLNGEVSIDQVSGKGVNPDYVYNNPYFESNDDNATTCPIQYQLAEPNKPLGQGNFMINETALTPDDYCYYDTTGRHCFRSFDEAQRFAEEHTASAYADIVGIFSSAFGISRDSLTRYINGETKSLAATANGIDDAFLTDEDIGILNKLFNKDELAAPVQYYKRLVGERELQTIIGDNLLSSFGIDTKQYDLDSGDLFDILRGDLTSLSRLAMSKIDDSIGLPQGTVKALLSANSTNMRNCTLSSIASGYLAGILGIGGLNLHGNIYNNIGKQRITDVWKIPGDDFFGTNMESVIYRTGPIAFALKTKVPLANGEGTLDNLVLVTNEELVKIFGADNADYYSKQSNQLKIEQIYNKVSFLPKISSDANTAIKSIEAKIVQRIKNLMAAITPGAQNKYVVSGQSSINGQMILRGEISLFIENLVGLNDSLSLDANTVYDLLAGKNGVTPDSFVEKLSQKVTGRFAVDSAARLLGFDSGTDAYTAISEIEDTLKCPTWRTSSSGQRTCTNRDFQNWAKLYSSLNKVFAFNFDTKLGVEPGTIGRILENYKRPGPIIFEIGAKRLDQSLGLDSAEDASISELYRRFGSGEDASLENANQACYESSYGTDSGASLTKAQMNDANKAYMSCKKVVRSSSGRFLELAKDAAVVKVGDKIREKSGLTMTDFDIRKIFDGDLRYLQIAGMAYGANLVYVALDKVGGRNCNSTDGGQCELSVPDSMRVSYEDIRMSFFGDQASDQAAENAAAWAESNDEATAVNPDSGFYNYGDVCPPSSNFANGAIACITSAGFVDKTESLSRDGVALVSANTAAMYAQYGTPDPGFSATGYLEWIDSKIAKIQDENNQLAANPSDENNQTMVENSIDIENLRSQKVATTTSMETARAESRKIYKESVKYRMLDALFWKLDDNVFPGFAQALFRGSAQDKSLALATYLKNGLLSGHIFGVNFDSPVGSAQELDAYLSIVRFTRDWDMDKFIADSGGGFDYLTNLLSSKSKDWLGFEINDEMAQGLIVGISEGFSTGNWSFGFDEQQGLENTSVYTKGGRTINTLANSVTNWATSKLFKWLDDRLGWEPGTAQQTYQLAKTVYDANKAYRAAKTANDAAKITEAAKALASAYIAAFDFVAQSLYKKFLSDDVAELEKKWGLVPGTLDMVASAAITVGVTYGVTTVMAGTLGSAASSSLMTAAIGAFWAVVVIAVLINLFSVYKTEVYCSADNYYPEAGESPDPSKYDVTNLGVWNGAQSAIVQEKSIEAAQYKASRLIGDLLNMPNSSMFTADEGFNVAPIQIMTGRQEDVDAWNNTVTTNMCQKRLGGGSTAVGGVCGSCSILGNCQSNTRMGLWANPQTIAWTHLGY